jgi:hypothetical protein
MTGSDKKLITQPYSSQTPNKTQTSTPSKNDGKTVNPLSQTSSDSRGQAKDYVKNIINTLTGTQTQAPTTKTESIEKLKPLIENELKSFKKFIK